jgi:hypothetical protein
MNLYPTGSTFHSTGSFRSCNTTPPHPLETINQSTYIEISLMGAGWSLRCTTITTIHTHTCLRPIRARTSFYRTIQVSQDPPDWSFGLISRDREMPPLFDGYTFYTLKKWYAPYKYLSFQALVTVSTLMLWNETPNWWNSRREPTGSLWTPYPKYPFY